MKRFTKKKKLQEDIENLVKKKDIIIGKIIKSIGSYIFEIEREEKKEIMELAVVCTEMKNKIWIKPGDYVLIEKGIRSESKIIGEIISRISQKDLKIIKSKDLNL